MKCPKCGASSGSLVEIRDKSPWGTPPAMSCRVCGHFIIDGVAAEKKVHPRYVGRLCTVCNRHRVKSSDGVNADRLCRLCNEKLTEWEQGDRKTPAPFVKILGIWVKNIT